jgi:hypothetical protein
VQAVGQPAQLVTTNLLVKGVQQAQQGTAQPPTQTLSIASTQQPTPVRYILPSLQVVSAMYVDFEVVTTRSPTLTVNTGIVLTKQPPARYILPSVQVVSAMCVYLEIVDKICYNTATH